MEKLRPKNFLKKFNMTKFLHELSDAKALFEVIAKEKNILPAIVEKDYWLMHCLWGIQQQGYRFELKGGTSLSKAFNIIERFSEDIDIQIYPDENNSVKVSKNHNKLSHIAERKLFFENIAQSLNISGLKFERDTAFDDETGKMRNAGIRGFYNSFFSDIPELKSGIVLELGFDQTAPNIACDITSWSYEKANVIEPNLIDNRAINIPSYCPEYTFVEKLQAISTKYRLQQQNQTMPVNFLRHYYDVFKLLEQPCVLNFIGSQAYHEHKIKRFRAGDEKIAKNNEAFSIPDKKIRKNYSDEFEKKSAIYFGKQPKFEVILSRIEMHLDRL